MILKFSGRHPTGFVDLFQLFQIFDLLLPEVGFVETSEELIQISFGVDVLDCFNRHLGDSHGFREFVGSLVMEHVPANWNIEVSPAYLG